jgi:hypothetical protein
LPAIRVSRSSGILADVRVAARQALAALVDQENAGKNRPPLR